MGRRAGRRRARRARERGRGRRQGAAAAAARRARRRARRRRATPRAWTRRRRSRAELRATAAAGFVLARNHGTLLPLDGALAAQGRRARPERAPSRARSAAAARPSSRTTRSRRSTGCARRCRTPRSRYAPGVRTHTRLPVGRRQRRGALPRRRRDRARRRAARDRRVHLARDARPGAAAIEVHTTLRAERAGEHVIGCSGVGPPPARRSTASRSFDEELALRADADPGEALFAPPQHGVPVTLAAGQTRRGRAAPRSPSARRPGHVPAQPRAAVRRGRRARARGRAGARGRRRDRRRRHDRRRSRARASTARRSRCPAARTSSSGASTTRNPRTVVVVNAGAPVLMPWLERGARRAAALVRRARRRATRSPTCSSAPPSPAAGCRPRGRASEDGPAVGARRSTAS